MRNLKRALSLGLTAAMISGLMVMGSSAASYADVTSENNVEAIEVLESVGIMIGDENGNFNPDQNVTRNEMAVIMANLMEYNVANYKNTSPFTDVPSWAEPYVAACWTNGITSGYSDTIYGGSDNVTTAQAALMLMKALGYFQYASDFGSDWQLATTRQGNAIDLFVGVDSGVTQPMTRNDVAQLVLNTLQSGTVTASTDGSWTIGDVTINNNVQYSYVTSNQTYATAIDDVRSTSNTTDAGRSIVELGEQLYMGDLKLNDNTTDDFGRPSRTWSYDGKEVGTYAKTELLVESYTTAVTGREVYDLLTAATINDNDLLTYVDGTWNNDLSKGDLTRNNNDDLDSTGRGVLTEIYLDDDNDQITIASINTYLAQATGDYNEDKEYAPLEVYVDADDTHVYNVDVNDVASVADVADEEFYLVTISYADDAANGEIKSVAAAEVMEDSTVTKWSSHDTKVVDKLTVDGTQYNSAVKAFYDVDTLEDYDLDLLTDMSYNVYLDQYGYVIGVDVYEGELKYVFITGYDRATSNLSVSTATAAGIFLDGTMEEIKVNVKDTNENIQDYIEDAGVSAAYYGDWVPGDDEGNPVLNRWYQYSVNESGVYTLKPTRMTATLYADPNAAGNAFEEEIINTANVNVRNNVSNANTRVYGEDASVYITVDTDIVDTRLEQEVTITDVDGLYTGVQNVELEIDTSNMTIFGQEDYKDGFDPDDPYDEDNGSIIEAQVYTVYDKDNYVIGAIVLGDVSGSGDYAYITSDGATSEEKIGDTYYWEFEAIFEGEAQTLTAKSKYTEIINTIANHRWEPLELRFDPDGYVVRVEEPEDVYTYVEAIDEEEDIDEYDVYYIDSLTSNGNPVDDRALELNLQGRTLYVVPSDADNTDMGLALVSDAKAVVIQDENRKANVKTNFTSVRAAISHLVDADDDVDGMQYEGKIFAVLNSNGSAAWIVFDSETPLITGEGGIITGTQNVVWNGNVGLWGNDDDIDVNGISFNPSTDRVNYSFYVLDADGTPVDEITDVTYDVDVYVNGQKVSSSVDDVEGTSNASGLVSGTLYVAAEADDVVEVVISNVAIDDVDVPVNENIASVTLSNGGVLTLKLDEAVTEDTTFDYALYVRGASQDEFGIEQEGTITVKAGKTSVAEVISDLDNGASYYVEIGGVSSKIVKYASDASTDPVVEDVLEAQPATQEDVKALHSSLNDNYSEVYKLISTDLEQSVEDDTISISGKVNVVINKNNFEDYKAALAQWACVPNDETFTWNAFVTARDSETTQTLDPETAEFGWVTIVCNGRVLNTCVINVGGEANVLKTETAGNTDTVMGTWKPTGFDTVVKVDISGLSF